MHILRGFSMRQPPKHRLMCLVRNLKIMKREKLPVVKRNRVFEITGFLLRAIVDSYDRHDSILDLA